MSHNKKSTDALKEIGEEEDDLSKPSSGHSSSNALLNIDTIINKGSEALTKKEKEVIETPKVVADVPKYTCT